MDEKENKPLGKLATALMLILPFAVICIILFLLGNLVWQFLKGGGWIIVLVIIAAAVLVGLAFNK